MLKMVLLDCSINTKCCSVDGGRAICLLFPSPSRGIWQFKSPHPQEFAIQGKKNALRAAGSETYGYILIPHTSRSYFKLPGYIAWVQNKIDEKVEMLERFSDFWSHLWTNRTMAVKREEAKYFTIKPSNLSEVFHRLTEYSEANLRH